MLNVQKHSPDAKEKSDLLQRAYSAEMTVWHPHPHPVVSQRKHSHECHMSHEGSVSCQSCAVGKTCAHSRLEAGRQCKMPPKREKARVAPNLHRITPPLHMSYLINVACATTDSSPWQDEVECIKRAFSLSSADTRCLEVDKCHERSVEPMHTLTLNQEPNERLSQSDSALSFIQGTL